MLVPDLDQNTHSSVLKEMKRIFSANNVPDEQVHCCLQRDDSKGDILYALQGPTYLYMVIEKQCRNMIPASCMD